MSCNKCVIPQLQSTMKKKIKYQIKITFDKARPECSIGHFLSPYKGSKGNLDSLTFNKNLLRIDFERSKLYTEQEILSNNKNSVYEQVQKSLLAYYAMATTYPIIKKCTLLIFSRDKVIVDFTSMLNQPIRLGADKKLAISYQNSIRILQNDSKGIALRSAISYWLTGMCSVDLYQKFDKLWRAFDRILLYEGNTVREKDGIKNIKTFLRNNSSKFNHSIEYAIKFPINTNLMSWGKLFMDKPADIRRKMTEYSDYRIISIYNKVFYDRKIQKELTLRSETQDVLNHFLSHNASVNEIELVLLLSLTYTYFIRCKMFHAEFPDSSFKLISTYEDKIINALSGLLEIVVQELIEVQALLR